jgi:hypothetical protein
MNKKFNLLFWCQKRLNISYWMQKIFVSVFWQFILEKLFFVKRTFIRKLIFKLIFNTNHWGGYQKIDYENLQVSGGGSIPNSKQTQIVINGLTNFCKKENISNILDMPCGDFAWMKDFMRLNHQILYTGYDVVEDIIEINNQNYSANNIKFFTKDIVEVEDYGSFDLVFIRDFFIHISNKEIIRVINNLKNSNVKFFAFSSHNFTFSSNQKHGLNSEVALGQHRKLNMCIEPFNMKDYYFSFSEAIDGRFINFYKNF